MALDATPAGATADSYLSVEEADAMAGDRLSTDPRIARWLATGTTTAAKEQALRTATDQVNAEFTHGWPLFDHAAQRASGLRFPRLTDHTGTSPQVPFIPREVRNAVFAQATHLLLYIGRIAAAQGRQAQELQSASEPNLSWSRSDAGGSVLCDEALQYLTGLIRSTSGNGLRSVRMGARLTGAPW